MQKLISNLISASPYLAGIASLTWFLQKPYQLNLQQKIISLALESILNFICSAILKQLIRQPRPASKEFGFPSSHTMFWGGYAALLYLEFQQNHLIELSIVVVFLVTVTIQRIRSNYHSTVQAFGGILIGILFSFGFYLGSVFSSYVIQNMCLTIFYHAMEMFSGAVASVPI